MNNDFVKLKNVRIEEIRDDIQLDTLVLEQEMRSNNGGIDISKVKPYSRNSQCDGYRKHVPFFDSRGEQPKDKVMQLVDKYPGIETPCSMRIGSLDELTEHMNVGYQVAHFHYILGKNYNLKDSFPEYCCGTSSRNVALSLMDFGYINAAYAYSNKYDHGYVILPFVYSKGDVKGTIVIDPTYDQLWKRTNQKKDERNAVFLKIGTEWEYRTDWACGANLFPDKILSIDAIRKTADDLLNLRGYHPTEEYFKKAFANPKIIKYQGITADHMMHPVNTEKISFIKRIKDILTG